MTVNQETPAQDKLVKTLNTQNKQLASLISLKQSGMSLVTTKEINALKMQIKNNEMKLRR